MKNIGIHYGAMSKLIHEQLDEQELKYDKGTIENYERCLDGLMRCRFAGVILDSVYSKILPKIHKKIIQHVAKKNKLKIETI